LKDGAAFGKIVASLVEDVVMPLLEEIRDLLEKR
jgi:large-conductance mechanosensitive channel